MTTTAEFRDVFDQLARIVRGHGRGLTAHTDTAAELILTGPMMERWNKELWFGGVRLGKAYVSYHLMPVYMFPDLLDGISPALRGRMQGKSCFNFKQPDAALFEELDRLTAASIERLRREGLLDADLKQRLKRPIQSMPDDVKRALVQRGVLAAYRARPPYQQNDYLGWINRAKRKDTKAQRLQQMLAELTAGDLYMKMKWRRPARPL